MKNLWMFLLVMFLVGCSSSYTPSEKMLAYKKDMTAEQAVQVLQKIIWDIKGSKGICGSRGFWYDDASNMKVHKDKIYMLAHKRGKQLKKIERGFNGVVVFEKQYFEFDYLFNKVSSIRIYDDPLLLPVFPSCNKKDWVEKYLIIDLYGDKLNSFKFVVPEKEFDKSMAAISILMADKIISIK
jgi:hypothetical protein